MLTKQQNRRFTEIGPGTSMGNLMRRYWQPFATVKQLHDHPTRAITLLGEHLVAFRDRSGRYGLVQEFCPHRNSNLLWGIPEPEGLRCPYHGWLFDADGNCLEQPAESPDSTFKDRIRVSSYPVEELGGMLWAWMGPEPRPMVPHWEAFVRPDVVRSIGWAVLPCNWLQIMENSLDPVHVEWLHRYFSNYVIERLGLQNDAKYWRGQSLVQHHEKIGFDVFEHGIIKRRVWSGSDSKQTWDDSNNAVHFPLMLRHGQIRVPTDDTHTLYWWYNVHRKREGDPDQPPEDIPIYQVPLPGVDEEGLPIWDVMDNASGQDNFAWQSQGPITPRWTEHLGESDKGIILYRRLLREQMKIVEDGGDPMNTFRDPATNVSIPQPGPKRSDDPENRERFDETRTDVRQNGIGTGGASKYDPVGQQRAREAGVPAPAQSWRVPVGPGQIHPRE